MADEKKKTTVKKPETKTTEKPKTDKKTQAKKTPAKKPVQTKKPTAKKTDIKTTEKPKTEKKTETKKTPAKKPVETKKPTAKTTKNSETKEEKEIDEKEDSSEKEDFSYKVKIKPKMPKDIKQKIQVRKQIKKRTPEFLREEWFRYKRIPRNWRRPDGITSKMRINLNYRPSKVRVGFRGPKDVRGLHSSGFEEVMVYNVDDVKRINKDTQAARIGSSVGTRKRLEIEKKAEELNIRILNM